MRYLACLAILLIIPGCATSVRLATPPVDLLACKAEATPPDLPAVPWQPLDVEVTKLVPDIALIRTLIGNVRVAQRKRDEATFSFILDERLAGGDCRAKVAGLKAWADAVD